MGTAVDGGTSVRGAYEVRQRAINVEGHDILDPANGSWYQTSEAVRIVLDLRQRHIRIAKKVVDVWHSKTPPWIGISYQRLLGPAHRRYSLAVYPADSGGAFRLLRGGGP